MTNSNTDAANALSRRETRKQARNADAETAGMEDARYNPDLTPVVDAAGTGATRGGTSAKPADAPQPTLQELNRIAQETNRQIAEDALPDATAMTPEELDQIDPTTDRRAAAKAAYAVAAAIMLDRRREGRDAGEAAKAE